MTKRGSVFPLRLRSSGLRELARVVAEHDHISQNELIEQAVANEVLVRGATIIADLEHAAERLTELTDHHYEQVIARSAREFAEGESRPDPLQAYAFEAPQGLGTPDGADPLGVMSAFNAPLDAAGVDLTRIQNAPDSLAAG
jgi:hypothetical protein